MIADRLPHRCPETPRSSWRDVGVILRMLIATAVSLLCLIAAPPTTGEDNLHHAGVIVRHGDGRLTYAYIAFREEEITGIDLLRRSGIEQVTIPFGGLGEGVCSLEGEGCPASDCRRRVCQGANDTTPYWRYFRQQSPGDWRAIILGASTTTVRDGDIDGWSWSPNASNLPAATIADVARLAGVDEAGQSGDAVPPPAVRTIYPPGVTPPAATERQRPLMYVAAGAALLGIGLAAVVAVRRGRHPREIGG